MGSPHLHHASDVFQAVAADLQDTFTPPTCSPLDDMPVGVAPALPKLSLQYTSESAMVAKHAGKNKGKRLALLLIDMAWHKYILQSLLSLLQGTKIEAI